MRLHPAPRSRGMSAGAATERLGADLVPPAQRAESWIPFAVVNGTRRLNGQLQDRAQDRVEKPHCWRNNRNESNSFRNQLSNAPSTDFNAKTARIDAQRTATLHKINAPRVSYSGRSLMSREPISDETLRAIGHVLVEFTRLELALRIAVDGLADGGQEGTSVLSSFLGYADLAKALDIISAKKFIRDPAKTKAFKDIVARLNEAGRRRNFVAHSLWSESEGRTIAILQRKPVKKWSDMDMKLKPVEELKADADYIRAVGSDLWGIVLEVMLPTHPAEGKE